MTLQRVWTGRDPGRGYAVERAEPAACGVAPLQHETVEMRHGSPVTALLLTLAACSSDRLLPPLPDDLEAHPVVAGLEAPVHLTAPPGDARIFIVEQPGRIRVVRDGALLAAPFLDITDRVLSGGERGLLSLAFDPDYADSGWFWVNYTGANGATRVERYRVSAADPDRADVGSATLVLQVEQPFANHNGGQIAFGPDGYLYIGMGDGGGAGDPQGHGQNLGTLLGALLRLDVHSSAPYAIPPDNPYAGSTSARPEIWAHGLRNPWRFSFDFAGDVLYVADVGQRTWEEINARPADEGGVNYGWNTMEGAHCYNAESCSRAGLTLPVHEYSHDDGCSVTGGHVYRGAIAGLRSHYFYADYCSGWIRSFRLTASGATDHREWAVGDVGRVLSFGTDAYGELYVLSQNGTVYRLAPPAVAQGRGGRR
jgi:glucose/arabinose dehydrogenase